MSSEVKDLIETLKLDRLPNDDEIKFYMKSIPSNLMLIHYYKDTDTNINTTISDSIHVNITDNSNNIEDNDEEYIMFYNMNLDTHSGWISNSPIAVDKDGSQIVFESFDYCELIKQDSYVDVDVRLWPL